MKRSTLFAAMAILAVIVGLYPAIYFFVDRRFGLLASKSAALLADLLWNTGFYMHIIFGGIALLSGWPQFLTRFRNNQPQWHRRIGWIYLCSVLLSSVAGIAIGFSATGGAVAASGFITLGIIWLLSTITAYRAITTGAILQHQRAMIFSYAACFSAVTLRLWLPLLILLFRDFDTAYVIVSWMCWVPNLSAAWILSRRLVAVQP